MKTENPIDLDAIEERHDENAVISLFKDIELLAFAQQCRKDCADLITEVKRLRKELESIRWTI